MSLKFAAAFAALALSALPAVAAARPSDAVIDREVAAAMARADVQGLAVAVVEDGQVAYVRAFGKRNAKGDPLTDDTVMYGASLTKTVFSYLVLQLADEGVIDLDASISKYLAKPLPAYTGMAEAYSAWDTLADERWRQITFRKLLTHSSGFSNFYWLEPDETLRIHFDPGSRYGYSGDGIMLMQFVLEQGLGLDVQKELQRRFFDSLGMTRTSLIWRPEFADNLADGWDSAGKPEPHDDRSRVRAAGSMDTTIADLSTFAAAVARGYGLSPKMRAEMTRAQLPITTASQFPTLQPELPPERRRKDLAAGLGVVVFDGPQGRGFFKGGHNDVTGNSWVCIERTRSCVVLLGNDVRAEALFPELVARLLGETGVPYDWEYGGPDGQMK